MAMLVVTGVAACALQRYQPAPLDARVNARQFEQRRLDAPELRAFMAALGAAPAQWPLSRWAVDDLFLAALFYHPDLAVDRSEWRARLAAQQAAARRPPVAINPQLEHHSEPDGESAWTVGALIDIVIPGPGKRAARVDAAAARAEAARLQLGETAWRLRERLQRAALTLTARGDMAQLAAEERDITAQALNVLERRREQGVATTLEVSSMRLRRQRAHLAFSQANHGAATARADLAAAIGVPVAAVAAVTGTLADTAAALPAAPSAAASREAALTRRYDVRRALADYGLADARLRGAVADQYPDLTLSPGFLFDQDDRVWVLEASWLLLLPRHNDGPIAAARAERDSAAARFRAVQARAIAAAERARADYLGALDVKQVAERTLAAQRLQTEEMRRRVAVGYTDRLTLLAARIETIAARRARQQARFDARRAFAALETALESPLPVDREQSHPIRRFVALGADAARRAPLVRQAAP